MRAIWAFLQEWVIPLLALAAVVAVAIWYVWSHLGGFGAGNATKGYWEEQRKRDEQLRDDDEG